MTLTFELKKASRVSHGIVIKLLENEFFRVNSKHLDFSVMSVCASFETPALSKQRELKRKNRYQGSLYSGHTANTIAHLGILEADAYFLQKPFSANALAIRCGRYWMGKKE
jgi:hypothetical protein